ncbi:hypothetical protein ElyMa_002583900 [Elysia marginata]|uniref:Uncharacterized protein n=1 Tax=Elysia marginata TaxID=1093978 RepID=A0AAV4H0K3_9GAST|nr:hypothetical protein ElyMa_002583900 [Elysia marginata]
MTMMMIMMMMIMIIVMVRSLEFGAHNQIPANQAMSGYFVTEGRPLTTLPVVLNRDLSRIINSNLQLKSSHDLEHLRSIAQQRDEWTKLTARIREAAEASQSEH